MSILCSICQDFLTERPQAQAPNNELVICTLRCGHLFHSPCIEKWFTHQNNAEGRGNRPTMQTEGNCPCCKKSVSLTTAIRVFPTCDEESNSIVELKRSLDATLAENGRITTELDDLNQVFQRISTELEEEIVAHDMLKMEYGQALSKTLALQEQVSDNLKMKTVLENSVKSELGKLENEKKEALRTIMELESREKKLIAELETLRMNDKENVANLFQKTQISHSKETASLSKLSKSMNLMIIRPAREESSDGESPIISPSTSQSNQPVIPLKVVPSSDAEESNNSDCN